MFTGLVQQTGRFEQLEQTGDTATLRLTARFSDALQVGESIAVNGACLTLVEQRGDRLAFDVLRETLDKTALAGKKPSDLLNLERALRMGDPLGGHLVSGHVDGIGRVQSIATEKRDTVLTISAPSLVADLVPKGSITIDGMSLTLVSLSTAGGLFSVHIIPHTWQHTALHTLTPGDPVNLETDMLGKFVRAHLAGASEPPPVTWERLQQAGFLD